MFEEYDTLVELLYQVENRFSSKPYLQFKDDKQETSFSHITFGQFKHRVESLAASLHHLGVRKGDHIGLVADNQYKWIISDMAILSLGAADVPRGNDSTADEIRYILNHADVKYCFVDNPEQAEKVLSVRKDIKTLHVMILMNGNIHDITTKWHPFVTVLTFHDLMVEGEKLLLKLQPQLKVIRDSVKAPDLATLIYTSGTTGPPKGVMLTHRNIIHNVRNLTDILPLDEKDRWLSILPVWHIFERTIEYIIMAQGCSMAYSKPTANHLLPDLALIKPTYMASVPRVWESIYNGIIKKMKAESRVKFALFTFFIAVGKVFSYCKKTLRNEIPRFKSVFFLWDWIWKMVCALILAVIFIFDFLGDIIIFRKIRVRTGGCLCGPISGGGALPKHVDTFFSAIKFDILEGYGMTETSPVIAVRTLDHKVMATVGRPIPKTEVRICDDFGNPLPNQHDKGILHVRGDLVMKGYYKDEEKTLQVLSKEGWLNTGDIGRFTMTGDIQITGRAKDTIVLIGGENIEPAPIEALIQEHPLVSHVMVYGQDKKHLSAIIVPEEEHLKEFAALNKIAYKDLKDLCDNDKVLDEFNRIINSKISTQNGFKSFERIYFFILVPEAFKVGEELTASLKMKRNFIASKYEHEINLKCYAKLSK